MSTHFKRPMSNQSVNPVLVDDLYFETDDADGLGLRNGAPFEPEVTAALKRWIVPGMTVLDIGANVGYFSACMSRLVGPAGKVHAFEPAPRNFELLQQNVAANQLGNVTCHPIALGDRTGTAKLHLSEFSAGMHRLYDSFCCGDAMVEVPVRRLDTLFSPGDVSVIKIDVEGFEPFVLEGATALLRHGDLTIISEYCPPAMLEAGASPLNHLDNLQGWGLKLFDPSGDELAWDVLEQDARRWEALSRERLVDACQGQSNPQIAGIVEEMARGLGCSRPYIENLVFQAP